MPTVETTIILSIPEGGLNLEAEAAVAKEVRRAAQSAPGGLVAERRSGLTARRYLDIIKVESGPGWEQPNCKLLGETPDEIRGL